VLLTETVYRQITGDAETPADAVATASSAAQDLLEDALARRGFLELDERTEELTLEGGGYVYPTAVPIIDAPGLVVHDDVVYGATPSLPEFVGLIGSTPPVYASVTYTGGFDSDTAPGYMLRDLAFAAWGILRPAQVLALAETPGATSVRVGDVALSFGAGGAGGGTTSLVGVSWSAYTLRHRGLEP
jgi:hypothetical protein